MARNRLSGPAGPTAAATAAAPKGRAGTETANLDELLAGLQNTYAEAESRSGGAYFPPIGDWDCQIASFEVSQQTTREGDPYARFDLGLEITSPGSEQGNMVHWMENSLMVPLKDRQGKPSGEQPLGINRFKGYIKVLNEGEDIDDLNDAREFMQQCVQDRVPCVLRVSPNKNNPDWPRLSLTRAGA
jgi:hypothetical protein